MGLREYKRKRHFKVTPEPAGRVVTAVGRSYVIQKHHASHLHYDFRLELDGVLKSWAVPKGPSLDPDVKRLAMHVEDHPVEYGSFEGIIPAGEYGGGTVMLWDRGSWEPIEDPEEGFRKGRLKFKLHGEKLHGGWMLVRTGGAARSIQVDRRWLLIKERDDDTKDMEDGDVLEEFPMSVATGRSLEEIAADRDRVWNAKDQSGGVPTVSRPKPHAKKKTRIDALPRKIEVQLATLAEDAPEGDEWFHEIKFDGYRMICRMDRGEVRFITRNHHDWTKRLAGLSDAAKRLPVKQAIMDGEVVALRPDGTTDFQELQNAFRDHHAEHLYYYVFDLLFLDGADLSKSTLEERKLALASLLEGNHRGSRIRFSEHIEGNGPAFFKQASAKHLEGIVSKRRDRPYHSGRGFDWLKIKCVQHDEFVIGGYSEPAGSRTGFGALLVGYHDRKGALIYAGRVGTGFDDTTLRTLRVELDALEQIKSPFDDRKTDNSRIHWVRPSLVAQVAFGSWTKEGILRHSSFQGLREDKRAAEVGHEQPVELSKMPARKADRQPSQKKRNAMPSLVC